MRLQFGMSTLTADTTQPTTVPTRRILSAQQFVNLITFRTPDQYNEFYSEHEELGLIILIKDVAISEAVELSEDVIIEHFLVIESGVFSSIHLNGCIFRKDVRIRDGTFQNGFKISQGTVQGEFWVEGGNFQGDFQIEDGLFINDFIIYGGAFEGDFRIQSGQFNGIFGIYGGDFRNNFWLNEGTFHQEFRIEGGTIQNEFNLKEGYVNSLYIKGLVAKLTLSINRDLLINNLTISGTVPKDSLLQIRGHLCSLSFIDVQNFGTIILNELSYRTQLYIPESVTLASTSDKNSVNKPELSIENSDLGKTTFINCDLSGFGLKFLSSKITDVFVTGTQMPREITTLDARQQQLGYSQIKKIYEARGDRVESNRYLAREMEAYQVTLSWGSWSGFWEKLNLSLNKYSTYYGQSWQRGLLSTLLVNAFFFSLYCHALGYELTYPNQHTLPLFWKLASYILEFLNPIHKADYVAEQLMSDDLITNLSYVHSGTLVNGWARIIEGVSRIFIAYFVYQFIQAFRKHGKSSG